VEVIKVDINDLQTTISNIIERIAEKNGVKVRRIDPKTNLLKQGTLDSVGLIEVLSTVEMTYNIQINFMEDDPDTFSSLNGLVSIVQKKTDSIGQQSS
jgi:acyl carrier protein